MKTSDIIIKAEEGGRLEENEILKLIKTPLFSAESAQAIATSRRMSWLTGKPEVHAQIGLNISPECPCQCSFCAFSKHNKIFNKPSELSVEETIKRARNFEKDGANAIYLMITADYDFGRFIETACEVKKNLQKDTPLVANLSDFGAKKARKIKDAGFCGIYHALRLREGEDTRIKPEQRFKTIKAAKEEGLLIGTCVEPLGPEHSDDEILDAIVFCRMIEPVFAGAARRINLPTGTIAKRGLLSQARLAHLVAVCRLANGVHIPGNCTHEPYVSCALSGANLLWAESGSNPRDSIEETDNSHGLTIEDCQQILREAEYEPLTGPSRYFSWKDTSDV